MSNFTNQFPYSDFHELNLDWLINKTKELQVQMKEVQETLATIEVLTKDQIEILINDAIAANNLYIAQQLIALRSEITLDYKSYCNQQIAQLTIYVDNQDSYYDGLAQTYAANALNSAKAYTDSQVLSYTMMINPITGEYEDVRNVVDDIVSYFHTQDSLTAAEYDALALDASYYDAKQLNAYDYDFNGKTLLP